MFSSKATIKYEMWLETHKLQLSVTFIKKKKSIRRAADPYVLVHCFIAAE